jgi:hypothetical protein
MLTIDKKPVIKVDFLPQNGLRTSCKFATAGLCLTGIHKIIHNFSNYCQN